MGQLKTTGTFLFDIVEACVCETSSKLPQWVASLVAVQAYDEDSSQWVDYSGYADNEITAYLVLFGKKGDPLFHAENLMKALGWDGVDFAALDQMDCAGMQIQGKVEESEYDGKVSIKLTRIDHKDADPSKTLRRLDVDDLKKLNARFASGLKKLGGGPKPKSAPAPVPAIATPAPPAPVEAPIETPAGSEAVKAAAAAAYEEKKSRKKKAEEVGKKLEEKAPPKPPMPPKPVAVKTESGIQAKYSLPPTCTQEEAWEACCQNRSADVDDEQLGNVWIETITNIGGEELIGNDWYKVRDGVLEIAGK